MIHTFLPYWKSIFIWDYFLGNFQGCSDSKVFFFFFLANNFVTLYTDNDEHIQCAQKLCLVAKSDDACMITKFTDIPNYGVLGGGLF